MKESSSEGDEKEEKFTQGAFSRDYTEKSDIKEREENKTFAQGTRRLFLTDDLDDGVSYNRQHKNKEMLPEQAMLRYDSNYTMVRIDEDVNDIPHNNDINDINDIVINLIIQWLE